MSADGSAYDQLACSGVPDGVEFPVKAVPGAARSRIAGLYGDALRLSVSAAPERGQANEAICELLAKVLGLKPAAVAIVSGHAAPRKRVRVSGLAADELRRRLCDAG